MKLYDACIEVKIRHTLKSKFTKASSFKYSFGDMCVYTYISYYGSWTMTKYVINVCLKCYWIRLLTQASEAPDKKNSNIL